MNKIIMLSLVSAMLVSGCASQSSEERIVSAREAAMQKQIADLQAQAAEKKEAAKKTNVGDMLDASSDYGNRAWQWLSEEAKETYQSDTSKEARERFNKCVSALKEDSRK